MVFCPKPAFRESNHLSRQVWRNVMYQGLVDFATTRHCRRLALSEINDKLPVECRTCQGELCDNCERMNEPEAPEEGISLGAAKRAVAQRMQQQQHILSVLLLLGIGYCPKCYLIGIKTVHPDTCPFEDQSFPSFESLFPRKENFCYKCSLPLRISRCVDEQRCPYRTAPRQVCWVVWNDPDLKESIFGDMGLWLADLGIESEGAYVQWLSSTIDESGDSGNNMWKLMCALEGANFLPDLS
ncbi:hypothetical protein TWF281_010574 [Arthrobotrys megalospora]